MSERRIAMSGADAAWLHMGRRENPMVITALVQLSEPLQLGELRELLKRRLLAVYPKFTMMIEQESLPLLGSPRLVRSLPVAGSLQLGGPVWVSDPDFDLSRHLHHIALPQPADASELRRLVSDLASTPLPMQMPPWQIHLIERAGQDTALVVRMHHCVADGIALARVLLSLTDELPGGSGQTERGAARGRAAAGARARDGHTAGSGTQTAGAAGPAGETHQAEHLGLETLMHPLRLVALARSGAHDVEVLARLTFARPDPRSGLKGSLSGLRRVGFCDPIDLGEIKAIARRHQATVNDVLLAAVAGALRSHLRRAGAGALRMRAIVPFNLRAPEEPMPEELGNRFGLVFLELPLTERGRRERLRKVKEGMDEIKRSPEGPVSYAVLQALGAVPQRLESRLVALFTSKGSAVVTNVPGPARPRLLAGARVASVQIWAPTSGSVGLSVSLISYGGGVTVGLMADPRLVADPQRIAKDVIAEVAAMKSLRAAPGARRAA